MFKKIKFKFPQGSVLVFSLIIMFILVVISIGIMSASVIERKSSGASGKATTAFQTADSGVEAFLQKIKGTSGMIGTILGASCSGSVFSGSIGANSYKITFYQADDASLTCADDISLVDHIKSVGTGSGATRAIEVAVAAGALSCESKEGAESAAADDSPSVASCSVGYSLTGCSCYSTWIQYCDGAKPNIAANSCTAYKSNAGGANGVYAEAICCKIN